MIRRLTRALAALLLVASPAVDARPRVAVRAHAAHPAIWRVSDRDSTIWLFGTIHALPPNFEWETAALRAIVARADRLVLEAVIDADLSQSAAALRTLGLAPPGAPPLAARVAPKDRPRLVVMAGKAGVPLAQLDRLKTWAAAMTLFGVTVNGLGVSAADGVEEQLKMQFRARGKPVDGLETVEQQLGFFDTLSEPQQRGFLASVLAEGKSEASDFGRMIGAWAHGDERGIQRSFDADLAADTPLALVLIQRRNQRWADLIAARLKTPGSQLVAVGAGHLVGPRSVQTFLARKGIRARRVQ